jgi:hypothetical protein
MKKNYKAIKMCIVLLALMTIKMSAQLNGLYTINSGSPASTSNYTSFTSLAADLNSLGVSGPVTVNVVANSGPYVEQVTFNSAVGASAVNSISINGNGNTITFNSSNTAAGWTMLLNSADFMAVSNLTIAGTGSAAYVVMLVGGADNNVFTNVRMACPANGTSSSQIPLTFSGASNTYANASNSGNNNTFTGCTLFSGYFGVVHYGLTGNPFNSNNSLINCSITDWYVYGVYTYYSKNFTVSGCSINRPTRTNITTTYPLFSNYDQGALYEKNRVSNLFDGAPGFTGTMYGFYLNYNSLSGVGVQQNRLQNNILKIDNNFNGFTYAIYCYYWNGNIDHNTIDLNNPNFSYTGGVYGFYGYGALNSYPINFRNNIISMNMGGSGAGYAFYCPITSGFTMNNNNIINYRSIGTNSATNQYHSYWNGFWYNQTQLAAQGANINGTMFDPNYINPSSTSGSNYMPTNAAMDNAGTSVGITNDLNNQTRGTVPDVGALEFLNTPCSGAPALTGVVTPTAIQCPSVVLNLGFASAYTLANMSFQWLSSTTSSVGPFTAISGSTTQALTTPPTTVNTWYTASVTCLNGNQSINANAGLIQIAGTTTTTVPYYENFEGITGPNRLPNCSWFSPNLGSTALTYTSAQNQGRVPNSGTKFATFAYTPSGPKHVYTNGVYLNAGVTYSTGLSFLTEYYGYANWSDLSILLGTSQTTTGLVTLATTGGAALSPIYKLLSGTFTVATSGLYYFAIRATSSGGCCSYWLNWDDFFVVAPCNLNPITVNAVSTATQVCLGQSVILTATGANSYTWSTGATTSTISVSPNSNTTYAVTGMNSLSGCMSTANRLILVNPAPQVAIFTNGSSICRGSSVNLSAVGAANYNWSNASNANIITVTPSVTTTYSVIGVNQFGCQGNAVQTITVNNLPNIQAGVTNPQLCVGETVTLSATGGVSYVWNSNSNSINGSNVSVSPNNSISYTVTGTDANGCKNNSSINLSVSACTGLGEITTTASGVKVWPNPTKGEFNVEFLNDDAKTIEVLDLTGRLIQSNTVNNKKMNVNLNNLSNGVYYIKIQTKASLEVVKVVKQ